MRIDVPRVGKKTRRLTNIYSCTMCNVKYFGDVVRSERELGKLVIIQAKVLGSRFKAAQPPQRWTDEIVNQTGLTLRQDRFDGSVVRTQRETKVFKS